MQKESLHFPKSFPNVGETQFLKMVLSSDESFPEYFQKWKEQTNLDDIEYAQQRLLPLLYLRIRKLKIPIDDFTTKRIQGVYKLAWVQNQQLLSAIQEVFLLFKEKGISMILLKGIPIVYLAYKDIGARFLGDADILIHPKNAKEAIATLNKAGWDINTSQFPDLAYFSKEKFHQIIKEATFKKRTVEIDVHWRIFEEDTKFTWDTLSLHTTSLNHKNIGYKVLSPEDMLIHIIVHGAEGNAHRALRWVTDTVAIITSFTINWDTFFERVIQFGYTTEIYIAFLFLQKHEMIIFEKHIQDKWQTLPLTRKKVKQYYSKSNTVYSFWGGLPRLWKIYKKIEPKRIFPFNVYYFLDFLAHVWGLEHKKKLIPFIWGKYIYRLKYYCGKIIKATKRKKPVL